MKFKLSSGREVDINRPSVRDRMRCGDLKTYKFEVKGIEDKRAIMGNATTQNATTAAFEWAACGLGVDVDEMGDYADFEIMEIGNEVEAMSNLNPTKESS